MIVWFTFAQISIALLGMLICAMLGARQRGPNDYTMGITLLVAVLLFVQMIVSVVQPFAGNPATGDPLEYWMYLIVAFAMPLGAGFWALIDRTRWANLVLAVVHFAIAVMLYRMLVIWGA